MIEKETDLIDAAAKVFGGAGQARDWAHRPATGLDGRRPVDLLCDQAGRQLLQDLLGRLEFGVYA